MFVAKIHFSYCSIIIMKYGDNFEFYFPSTTVSPIEVEDERNLVSIETKTEDFSIYDASSVIITWNPNSLTAGLLNVEDTKVNISMVSFFFFVILFTMLLLLIFMLFIFNKLM